MYLLFAGHRHYPKGGSQDFRGKFESIEKAKQWVKDNEDAICEDSYVDLWADILDADTIESVAYGVIEVSLSSQERFEKWHSGVEDYNCNG